jgi:hypothetical protein
MTSEPHYLSRRANWEAAANAAGASLEDAVASTLRAYLDTEYPDMYTVETHPGDFKQLYLEIDYKRNPGEYAKPETMTKDSVWFDPVRRIFIQGPAGKVAQCGCIPDVKIISKKSGKAYFLECKAQKDEGNAQERACKYATPSFLRAIQEKMEVDYHPIGYLFSGQLVNKRKYILELQLSFGFAADHLLLWKPERPADVLVGWFERTIRPLLEPDVEPSAA